MKRIAAYGGALALLLCGCGGAKDGQATAASSTEPASTPAPTAGRGSGPHGPPSMAASVMGQPDLVWEIKNDTELGGAAKRCKLRSLKAYRRMEAYLRTVKDGAPNPEPKELEDMGTLTELQEAKLFKWLKHIDYGLPKPGGGTEPFEPAPTAAQYPEASADWIPPACDALK